MIDFIDVSKHNKDLLPEIMPELRSLIESGQYILGRHLKEFERSFASYCGTRYCVGVNSGTDALILSLRTLKVKHGDVLTVSFTFPATVMAILAAGYRPKFVDVNSLGTMDPKDFEKKIDENTVAVIPVHFMGHPCNMGEIMGVANSHGIPVIEDACQAAGASYAGKKTGSFGYTGCFSFFPTKNLGALGDGGAILTDNEDVYKSLLLLRDFGKTGRETFSSLGTNTRLDEIQALVLSHKLKLLDWWIYEREKRAKFYRDNLPDHIGVLYPPINAISTYHLFVVTVKDNLKAVEDMKRMGVDCRTHYSVPCHRQPFVDFYEELPMTDFLSKRVMSLPISEFISEEQQNVVLDALNRLS
jgi:dTDP-4-amino-4,6-dideoxygalactose transaminase